MTSKSRIRWISQSHLEPKMSLQKWETIMKKYSAPDNLNNLTSQQIEAISNEIIETCNLSVAEIVAQVAKAGGYLVAAEDGRLLVRGLRLNERLRAAIAYHKDSLYRYVSAFPGHRWPTEQKGGDAVEQGIKSPRVRAAG